MGGPQAREGEGHKTQAIAVGNCTNYKKEGHIWEWCWFLHPYLWPKKIKAAERWKNKGFTSTSGGGDIFEEKIFSGVRKFTEKEKGEKWVNTQDKSSPFRGKMDISISGGEKEGSVSSEISQFLRDRRVRCLFGGT